MKSPVLKSCETLKDFALPKAEKRKNAIRQVMEFGANKDTSEEDKYLVSFTMAYSKIGQCKDKKECLSMVKKTTEKQVENIVKSEDFLKEMKALTIALADSKKDELEKQAEK